MKGAPLGGMRTSPFAFVCVCFIALGVFACDSRDTQTAPGSDACPSCSEGGTSTTNPSDDRDAASDGCVTCDGDRTDAGKEAGPKPGYDGGTFLPNPALKGIADNTAMDIGPFTCTDAAGEYAGYCRGSILYGGIVYDPVNHQMLSFGGGHATTMYDSITALDLGGSLKWTSIYAPTPLSAMDSGNIDITLGAWKSGGTGPYPRPISAHTYDFLAVAPDQNEFVLLGRAFTAGAMVQISNDISGPIAHFDLAGGSWSFASDPNTKNFFVGLGASAYDPISHKFVSMGEYGLALYDPKTRSIQLRQWVNAALGYANELVYFPPNDTFYYFVRGTPVQTFALKLDRNDLNASTVSAVPTTGPTSSNQEPSYDYDLVNGIIGGGVADNVFYAFDPKASIWTAYTITGATPGSQNFHSLKYDPVDNVFIFVADSTLRTWAYRFKG
jgi:hypothetical protein